MSSSRSTAPFKISIPTPPKNNTLRYNCYTKQYIVPKPPKTSKTFNKYIRYSSQIPTDDSWVGNEMPPEPHKRATRFWYQNCNGLINSNDVSKFHYDMNTLLEQNIHYISLSETNVNCSHVFSKYQIEHSFKQLTEHGRIDITNTPGFSTNSRYQPGGVAAGFHGRICNRYSKQHRDKCGRWIAHEFTGKTNSLKIYTLYRVNPKPTRGDSTAWQQQKRFHQSQGCDTDPRKKVIEDLLTALKKDHENGTNIILFADMNEMINSREQTNSRLRDIGLLNIMQQKLETDTLPRTHKLGSSAIDHMWISGGIINSISNAGFAPFDFVGSSDHRGLYCDIFLDEILDTSIVPLQALPNRRLKSTIPKRVNKYLELVEKQWKEQNINNRYQKIVSNSHAYNDEHLEKKLNDLDNSITNILRHAEKKCANVPKQGAIYWSPKLTKALKRLHHCRKVRNKARYVQPDTPLQEAIKNFNEKNKEYENTYKEYRELRGKDIELRIAYLTELATQKAGEDGNIDAEIKKLTHIEEQRRSHAKIRYVTKPNNRDGVTSILVPSPDEYDDPDDKKNYMDVQVMWRRIDPCGGRDIQRWERIVDKDTIEPMLLEWQRMHFLQANNTPFANSEWKQRLDDEEFQDDVLDGTYTPPPSLHPLAREVLEHIKRPINLQEIEFKTTFDEFVEFIKGAKEKTSTSPSGRNYSHYKSLLQGNHRFLQVIHGIIEMSIQRNIVLQRWKTTVTTLIEKDEHKPCIHRMRAIHIIEAEVQFVAKLFYVKKLMNTAEKNRLITDEQYGGRNRRQAQSAVINKILYYNLSRQMRMTSAFIDIDARACYDRIVTSLSGLEGRKWGAPYRLSQFTTKFIESQQYKIRTGFGISQNTYEYTDTKPTQGSGQGIAWAGPRWINSSDTCSKVMQKHCSGMYYHDPCWTNEVKKCGDYFIDDTATAVTANTLHGSNDIFQQAQHDEQVHAYTLNSMGHRIENAKSGYYILHLVRDNILPSCGLIHELEGQIIIQEEFDSEPVLMKRLQPFQAHRTLGCYVAINGQSRRQFIVLKQKIQEWATKIKGSFLNKREKITAYEAYIKKTIEYIAPTACMTLKQCQQLDSLITPILFHIHKIQRNCSKSVLYTPHECGGFGYKSIWHIQGLAKLKFFLLHHRRNDTTGKLIRASIRWTQLELGLEGQIFDRDHDKYKHYVTNTWCTHLWEYLWTCKSSVQEQNPWKYTQPRNNDFFIMDKIYKSTMSDEYKQIFNEVRLSMNVVTASDIVPLSSGSSILKPIYDGHNYRQSTWKWPNHIPFHKSWYKIWRIGLTQFILPHLRSHPLGKTVSKSHQKFTHFLDDTRQYLTAGKATYKRISTSRRPVFELDSHTKNCNIPADVTYRDQCITIISEHKSTPLQNPSPPNCQPSLDLHRLLNTAPQWMMSNWGHPDLNQSTLNTIVQELEKNNLNAAGDGSVKNGLAAHSWCLFKKNTFEVIFSNAASVAAHPTYVTSYRPEASSILAAASFLSIIATTIDTPKTGVTFFTDNKEAVTNSTKYNMHNVKRVLENDSDVTIELLHTIHNSKINFSVAHVKGHQDDDADPNELTPIANINIRMDEEAGTFIESLLATRISNSIPPQLPSQQVTIHIKGNLSVTHFSSLLSSAFYEDDVKKHYNNVVKLHHEFYDAIEWDCLRLTLKKNEHLSQYVKFIHGQWNTMQICKRWDPKTKSVCPVCSNDDEDWRHVLQCKDSNMHRVRTESIAMIKTSLCILKTNEMLAHHIIYIIRSWSNNEQLHEPQTSPFFPSEDIRRAHLHQCEIGFDLFFKGLFSKKWIEIQENDYMIRRLPRQYNITRWKKTLTEQILRHATTMWNERCTIVQTINNSTYEVRMRRKAIEYCKQIRGEKWKLPHDSRHLLERDEYYFQNTNLLNIHEWNMNIATALSRGTSQLSLYRDIREFFVTKQTRSCPTRTEKIVTHIKQTGLKFQQKICLFFSSLRN